MKYFYANGHRLPVVHREAAGEFLVLSDGAKVVLSRSDLYYLARRKYLGAIRHGGFLPRWVLSPSVEAQRLAVQLGLLSQEQFEKQQPRPPRRHVPHVRMVRAAALLPGMRIPRTLIRQSDKPSASGDYVVTGISPQANMVWVQYRFEPYNPMSKVRAEDVLIRQADAVLPVLIGWREKVAL